MKVVSGAAAGFSLAVAAYGSAATIEYLEIFPNTTGGNLSQSTANWVITENNLTPVGNTGSFGVSNAAGRPADAVPVNSGSSDLVGNGFMGHWGISTAKSVLFYTSEHPIDLAAKPLETISWYQGNGSASNAMRVALRIDGNWYLSTASFLNPVVGSGGAFGTGAVARSLDVPSATWTTLNADLSSGLPVVLPTSGTLQSFGLVAQSATATVRLDTYAITVPEPAAAGLLAAGLLLGCGRRRRLA